jgi:hypothetical protein
LDVALGSGRAGLHDHQVLAANGTDEAMLLINPA